MTKKFRELFFIYIFVIIVFNFCFYISNSLNNGHRKNYQLWTRYNHGSYWDIFGPISLFLDKDEI